MPTAHSRQTRRPVGDPDNTASASDVASLLREVTRLHVRAQRALVTEQAINQTHCIVLTELSRADSVSLGELSARLRMDKGWVSRVVDRMEEEQLVARTPDPMDGRAVVLTTTAAGRRLHARIERLLEAQVGRVIARMPATETAELHRLLSGLVNAYKDELL
jgi:DNA-binding MarR family transcriptional regulator